MNNMKANMSGNVEARKVNLINDYNLEMVLLYYTYPLLISICDTFIVQSLFLFSNSRWHRELPLGQPPLYQCFWLPRLYSAFLVWSRESRSFVGCLVSLGSL